MKNPNMIFYGLSMEYDGSPFTPDDDFVTAIHFTSKDADNIIILFGDSMPNPAGGKVSEMTPPFTGNGFTSASNGLIIPEFYSYGLSIDNGAQMVRITKEGNDVLIAIYDDKKQRFFPIE